MKTVTQILIIVFTCLLTSCMTLSRTHYANESWQCKMNLDPGKWLRHVDPWFLTGEPQCVEQYIKKCATRGKTISTMSVKVPNFTHIVYQGVYEVQIVGQQTGNSVTIIGPNATIRQISVEAVNNTLMIYQLNYEQQSKKNLKPEKVIIRIGVKNLRCLTNKGCGNVYGRDIVSNGLTILSQGKGHISLVGNMNLKQIKQTGAGTITVIGANSPSASIYAADGRVNVSGHLGIQSIDNRNKGIIHIIGADTDNLTICASGCSLTTIAGYANLKRVTASDSSRVYLYWVNSPCTFVTEEHRATVGLAGFTHTLNIQTKNASVFLGEFLRANQVYVQTHGASHANVRAQQKLFANATDNSTIYYYGRTPEVAKFANGYAAAIALQGTSGCKAPCVTLPPPG